MSRNGVISLLFLLLSATWLIGQEGPDVDSGSNPEENMLDEGEVDFLEGPGEDLYDSTELFLRTPSVDALREYREDERFDYDPEGGPGAPGIFERFMRWVAEIFEDLFGIGETVESIADIFPYLFFAAALGLLIWSVVRSEGGTGLFRKKVRREDLRFDEEVRDIHELDFPVLLAAAIAREDYRSGVRLHYLELLQRLSRKELIDWRPEKTNGEYLEELRSHPAFESMRRLTLIFDWVWYGEHFPERREYEEYRLDFERIGTEFEGAAR